MLLTAVPAFIFFHLPRPKWLGETGAGLVSGALIPCCSKEDVAMRTYDFSPLYRSTVGFDQLFDLLDQTARGEPSNWPPYSIERISDDDYRITMALAGFSPDEIELVQKENTLLVAGHKNAEQQQGAEILHRGIATRPFRQTFNLADHVKVTDARFENGLLTVELKREVPEALKPRRIEITSVEGGATSVGNVTTLEQSKVA